MHNNFFQATQEVLSMGGRKIYHIANEEYYLIQLKDLIEISRNLVENFKTRLVTMIATDERQVDGCFSLFYMYSFAEEDKFLGIKVLIPEDNTDFYSVTPFIHAAHWYEREAQDLFGLKAIGHPDPRPLVLHDGYEFLKVNGEGVFEVPVGPIHAGIIEPGHFRFSVFGEKILNLEPRLFYTHRGVEKLTEGKHFKDALAIVERTCGVCAFSHSVSYCSALEKIAGVEIPERALFLRTIFLELERLYNHIGDISNMCAGTGFHFGISQMAILKETLQNLNEELTGNRFLRGFCVPGGIQHDLDDQDINLLGETLNKVIVEYQEVLDIVIANEFFKSRMSGTGILAELDAKNLGAVGPAARACGINRDVRKEHPHLAYSKLKFDTILFNNGDVESRFMVRAQEVKQAFGIITQCLKLLPDGEFLKSLRDVPAGFALGYSESPRGDNYHWLKLAEGGIVERVRIRSASFCNWPAVAVSVPGNMIPDFPLINKSFELCYSCCDR